MHVITSIAKDVDLARFYEIDWEFVPNLMMDLTVPVLAKVMNIYLAGELFIIAAFVLIASGTFALNRALFGAWSLTPLITFPLLYNYVFLVGVMNYEFGIGLALWGLAVWVMIRERAWPLRLAVSAVFVLVLFFCHLYALGVYGLGLLAFELWRLFVVRPSPLRTALIDFVATGVPFLVTVPFLLNNPILTWTMSAASNGNRSARSTGSPTSSKSIRTWSPSLSRVRSSPPAYGPRGTASCDFIPRASSCSASVA